VPKVGFVSLGCPKALVDSERILTQLRAEGYVTAPDYAGADLVIVNTCGFIDAAVEESLGAIGEALAENGKVVVTGCLGFKKDLIRKAHPSVLAITGPHDTPGVMKAVHAHLPKPHDPFTDLVPPQGIKLTPHHYAYLKISEGCNHRCTFCIIPSMRGDLVSRPIGEVMQEAENLLKAGVKELLVISQDTSAYGVDVRYRTGFHGGKPVKTNFLQLCKSLGELGVWVRLHYVYPYPGVDDVIPLMVEGKILPYLDIPFQHASPRILRLMKRPAAAEKVLARIRAWRKACPELTIRSTFIAGFPGETEAEFEDLKRFLGEFAFDSLGVFPYSPEPGTPAPELDGQLHPELIRERASEVTELQEALSFAARARFADSTLRVLVDRALDADEAGAFAPGASAAGRFYGQAPEIDGEVFVAGDAAVGEFVDVRVTETDVFDLCGEVIPALGTKER